MLRGEKMLIKLLSKLFKKKPDILPNKNGDVFVQKHGLFGEPLMNHIGSFGEPVSPSTITIPADYFKILQQQAAVGAQHQQSLLQQAAVPPSALQSQQDNAEQRLRWMQQLYGSQTMVKNNMRFVYNGYKPDKKAVWGTKENEHKIEV